MLIGKNKETMVIIFIGLLTVVGRMLIVPRLDLPTATGSYEAFAHLFVGFLIGAWWRDRQVGKLLGWYQGVTPYGLVVILLTAFEVIMFVVQKRGG